MGFLNSNRVKSYQLYVRDVKANVYQFFGSALKIPLSKQQEKARYIVPTEFSGNNNPANVRVAVCRQVMSALEPNPLFLQ